MIAQTLEAPYYAVIFTSVLRGSEGGEGSEGYEGMAVRMLELAKSQEGFLGIESAREDIGITVSYWKDLESIRKWKENGEHLIAQEMGRKKWYISYKTRIALVERDYGFET